ncbi:MAG: hypothetical protein LIO62_08765 [Clostridiales bacterium]|nr:hypothetical protein [Clostridiales bacterium]
MKKIIYFTVKALYCVMVLAYILIPMSIVFFDVTDFKGEYRELICFISIFIFVVCYVLTVELPSIIFKVPVERYNMFSRKYSGGILSLMMNIFIVAFLVETIIYAVLAKQIMYYDALIFLLILFFRLGIRMASIELKTIKGKIYL